MRSCSLKRCQPKIEGSRPTLPVCLQKSEIGLPKKTAQPPFPCCQKSCFVNPQIKQTKLNFKEENMHIRITYTNEK